MQLAIRDTVVGHVLPLFQAAFPSLTIALPNAAFDWNNTPETFAELEVQFFGGEQVGVEASPRRRLTGYVYLTVFARKGTGERLTLQILDWFSNTMKFAKLAGLQLEAPEPEPPDPPYAGYVATSVKVFFRSNPG